MRGAEIVLLKFHSHEPCRVTRAGSVPLPLSRLLVQIVDEGQGVQYRGLLDHARGLCTRMVKTVLPLESPSPTTWAFYQREGAIDRVRCVVPMPVANSTTLRTTMDYYRPGTLQARVPRGRGKSRRRHLLYQALALRRRRTFRRLGWTGRTEFVEELPEVEPVAARGGIQNAGPWRLNSPFKRNSVARLADSVAAPPELSPIPYEQALLQRPS